MKVRFVKDPFVIEATRPALHGRRTQAALDVEPLHFHQSRELIVALTELTKDAQYAAVHRGQYQRTGLQGSTRMIFPPGFRLPHTWMSAARGSSR